VLVATANNSAQTLEDLGESMKYVAPIAAEAGETVQSTAKAIGVLANMQIKGSMAGTSLRKMLLSLADPAVQKKLSDMGVDAADAAGNLRPVGEVLSEIGRKMAEMGSGERLGLMNTLFGQRAAASAVKIATTDFDQLSEAIDAADGVAARTARTMDSGLGGSFRRLMSAVEGVMIAVGEALAGALGGVADKIAKVAVHIAQFISKNKQWVVGIAATIAAVAERLAHPEMILAGWRRLFASVEHSEIAA